MICKTKIYLFPPVLCIVMKLPEFNKSDTIWIVDISEMQCLWKTFQRQPWSLKKYLYVNYFWSNSKSIAWICNQLNVELLWCPIKVRVFHQNESWLSCPHPPLSYEGRRESKKAALILTKNSHFDGTLRYVGPWISNKNSLSQEVCWVVENCLTLRNLSRMSSSSSCVSLDSQKTFVDFKFGWSLLGGGEPCWPKSGKFMEGTQGGRSLSTSMNCCLNWQKKLLKSVLAIA